MPHVHGIVLHFDGALISIQKKSGPLYSQHSLSCLLVQVALEIFYSAYLTSVICFYVSVNICSCLGDEAYNYMSIVNTLLWFWLILILLCLCLLRQMRLSVLSDIF